jgi:hypothetical protein
MNTKLNTVPAAASGMPTHAHVPAAGTGVPAGAGWQHAARFRSASANGTGDPPRELSGV